MVFSTDLIQEGYNTDNFIENGSQDAIKENLKKPPHERANFMKDISVVGDRVIYDNGNSAPFTVMNTKDLDTPPLQLADASGDPEPSIEQKTAETLTGKKPVIDYDINNIMIKPLDAALALSMIFGKVKPEDAVEAAKTADAAFRYPLNGFTKLLLNFADTMGIERAREVVNEMDKIKEEDLKDASLARVITAEVGEVAGQFIVPGIKGFQITANLLKGNRVFGKLPKQINNVIAAALVESGLMAFGDDPSIPTMASMLNSTTSDQNPQGRALLEKVGMSSMQPYYDDLVAALASTPEDPEWEARWKKAEEATLIATASTPILVGTVKGSKFAVKSAIKLLKNWRIGLLAGGGALVADEAFGGGGGGIIRAGTRIAQRIDGGLDIAQDKTEANLRKKINRDENAAKGKLLPGNPNLKRLVVKSTGNRPDFVVGDITFDDWIKRTEAMLEDTEIDKASQFYSDINDVFLKATDGDQGVADKYMRSWLVAQQNVDVTGAMGNVLLQAEQFAQKIPVEEMAAGGMPNPTGAIRNVLQDETITQGVGQKIVDFVDAAENKAVRSWMGNDPKGGQPVVVDLHTARDFGLVDEALINHLDRLGYNTAPLKKAQSNKPYDFTTSLSETKYENRADFGRRLTDHLNTIGWKGQTDWTPSEIQAIGWASVSKITQDIAPIPQRAIDENMRRISFEISAGEGSPWAIEYGQRWNALPVEAQTKITQTVADEAIEIARKRTGINVRNIVHATGGWTYEGDIGQAPAVVVEALASKRNAVAAANILGYLTNQTEVWVNATKGYTKNPLAFHIDLIEDGTRNLDSNEEVLRLFSELTENDTTGLIRGYQMIRQNDGSPTMRIIMKRDTGVGGAKFKENVENLIETDITGVGNNQSYELLIDGFEAELTITGNNWKEFANGKGYLEGLERAGGNGFTRALDSDGKKLTKILSDEITAAEKGSGRKQRRVDKPPDKTNNPKTNNPPNEAGFLMDKPNGY